jgi:hypothetical protein
MAGFESKPAPSDPFKTSNSTAKIAETCGGDGGADRVGNDAPNPYGPNLKGK